MALVQCPECKSEISTDASKCPSCGFTLKVAVRSTFGKVAKWGFIAFNVLMFFWIVSGLATGGDAVSGSSNEFEAAGAAIGTGLGVGIIACFWGVGDIILGTIVLLTRPKA